MSKPIILVCGLARCGTSLTMSLLHAAGVPIHADYLCGGFESGDVLKLPSDSQWLDGCAGRAVKVLDPQRFTPPTGKRYIAIWLDRYFDEQAKSQLKFLSPFFPSIDRNNWKPIAKSLKRDRFRAVNILRDRCEAILFVSFESLIETREHAVADILRFVGSDADPLGISALIDKRGIECLPYLKEASC